MSQPPRFRSALSFGRAASWRTLALAFVGVAVAFVASTAVAEFGELEIRRTAAEIAGNSSPSIQFLAGLRGDLRQFTLLADDDVDRGVEGLSRQSEAALAGTRRRMDEGWRSYRSLPSFPGEDLLWPEAERARVDTEGAVVRLDDAMDRGDWPAARETLEKVLKPAAERLDAALLKIIDVNVNAGAKLARRIEELGRRSVVLAILLDGTSVLLTAMTALLLWRVMRNYTSLVERRADELEMFAGRVAHDVLGPLGAATLALDMAARDAPPGGRMARVLASGKSGLHRARSIADGLLEFARAGAHPQPNAQADALEVIHAVIEEVQPEAEARGIAVLVEVAAPGHVACSPGILTSLVSNLVRNAVKYVGDGPRRRIVVRSRPVGTRVRIEVEDNGRGLPVDLANGRVFEPYVRGTGSKEAGIGLGLATVKKITEAHGGRVEVRSVPGLGCRFSIELPRPRVVVARPAARLAARTDQESIDHSLGAH